MRPADYEGRLSLAREHGQAIHRHIMRAAAAAVAERERAARTVAVSHLPRRLFWLVDHPRLLRLFYRLRPSWRPMVVTPGMLDGVSERAAPSRRGDST